MHYVYIIQSVNSPDRYYTGITENVDERLNRHNGKHVSHTSKFAPWKLKTYIAFSDERQAVLFEKYLKSASGRAFAKKRL
jgi:putative endonuclease